MTFQHIGKFENGVATSEFVVLDAVGGLQGFSGTGSFKTMSHGEAEYQIEFEIAQ
jgi:hypothetical protein